MSQFESPFEENLYQLRREKLAQIASLVRAANPALTDSEAKYPNTFRFTHTVPELRALGDPLSAEELETMHIEAAIAGRVMAIRVQGKAGFATLQQGGQRLQIYVRKDDVGEPLFNLYKLLDLGDHIGVRGYLMRTRTGELTLHAAPMTSSGDETQPSNENPAAHSALTLLSKSMLPLPDKYSGLGDIELRYRRRYLDLFTDTGDTPEAANNAEAAAETKPAAETKSFAAETESPAEQKSVILSAARSAQSKDPDAAAPGKSADQVSTTNSPTRLPAREVFEKRAKILRSIRHFFDTRGYLEVETPMLHTIAGGAAARPFKTHHNALDIPLSLRIAPELYLKRLVVGGLDRVYEINRNFRNEGVSTQHNPEFTMLEFYQAYANYHDLMDLTQELITNVAQEVNGTTITNFPIPKGPRAGEVVEIDLAKWQKLTMREAIFKWWPPYLPTISNAVFEDRKTLRLFLEGSATINEARTKGARWEEREMWEITEEESYLQDITPAKPRKSKEIDPLSLTLLLRRIVYFLDEGTPLGKAISDLFEAIAEYHLIQPTIIYDFPLAVSPLSKVKPNEPDWVERFEFYIGGFEVGNAFSELNDPDDQRNRFLDQLKERDRGDDEAHAMDEDYVRALGYGLPPTAGEGIGIDRLTMILTGSRSIRDVILFPLMRPQKPPTDLEELHTHGETAE